MKIKNNCTNINVYSGKCPENKANSVEKYKKMFLNQSRQKFQLLKNQRSEKNRITKELVRKKIFQNARRYQFSNWKSLLSAM